MHFLSTAKVVEELKRGTLSSSTAFGYFCAWLLLNAVLGYFDMRLMAPASRYLFVQSFVVVAVTAIGLYRCYVANGGVAGLDLTQRFVALALPLTVQLKIAYEAVYWAAYWIYPNVVISLSDRSYETAWLSMNVAGAVLLIVIWYWRMTRLLRLVAQRA